MKKCLFSAAVVAAMAIGYTFSYSDSEPALSDIELANVEALADEESENGTITEKIPCYSAYVWEPFEHFVYCLECKEHSGHHTGNAGECTIVRPLKK